MSTQVIVALVAGIPTILGAITALIVAIKANNKVNAHAATVHSDSPISGSENRH